MTPLEMLQLAYMQKKSRNPRFSLRSFAKQLDMDPSNLSKVLSGKRKVPPSKLMVLADMFFDNDKDKLLFIEESLDDNSRRKTNEPNS